MLTVWPSIAEGFPTLRSQVKFIQKQEESLGRDETPCQTSHGHFRSIIIIDKICHLFPQDQFKRQLQEEQELRKTKEEEVKALQGDSASLLFTK